MFKLGLTGGIGSGKSTVAKILRSLGATLIDADAISRQSTQAGGAAIEPIRLAFGSQTLNSDGALNREAMRALLTQLPDAQFRLEAIIHPIVSNQIAHQLEKAEIEHMQCAVLDIPLLAEGGYRWRSQLDAVWVVDCLPETQLQRVAQRSGWPSEQIQSVMSLQAGRHERLACADTVIYNEGLSLLTLEELVHSLAKPLL